jgi:GDP-D-mannose dehydratase
MAAVAGDRKKTACVTGGNGCIASLLIKMLLEKGYVVKTTVRNPGLFRTAHLCIYIYISAAALFGVDPRNPLIDSRTEFL